MIYFDHNASTPMRPEAIEAMSRALAELHANPSSAHREGQRVRAAVEQARERVAALVGARPAEVVFVSGGTEGDHAGIIGAACALEAQGRGIAVSSVEHHAVHGAGEVLERQGFTIAHLAADRDGRVLPGGVDTLPAGTTLVSIMLANNETGVLQPVADIARRAQALGIRVHCDAVQAAGKVPVDVAALGVDYLVISAHKLGGPKGIGGLVIRAGAPFEAQQRGSAHEGGRRGGTENVPGIVGFGVAADIAARSLASESARLTSLRDRLEAELLAAVPDVVFHGRGVPRLPNTVSLSVPGARTDHMLMALDARGVEVSAGAACASGAVEPSPVMKAMGVPRDLAICAVRLSMGHTTTADDIAQVVAAVAECSRLARKATSPSSAPGAMRS